MKYIALAITVLSLAMLSGCRDNSFFDHIVGSDNNQTTTTSTDNSSGDSSGHNVNTNTNGSPK